MMRWSDGLPEVEASDATVDRFIARAGLAADFDLGKGVLVRHAAAAAVRAGCLPTYMPVIVSALEAVLDPAFHIEHLASPWSPWPAFIVNGPIARKLELYAGPYVTASGRRANVTIGRAISLALGGCLPGLADGRGGTFGSHSRMAGLVMAEIEDTPWEPLSVMLGEPRGTSTVCAFSTTLGSPMQLLPVRDRYARARPVAALIAEACSEGWCGPGTTLLVISPNAQRVFLEDHWSKADLRSYLLEHVRISVAQLKRTRRWIAGPGQAPLDHASAPVLEGDEDQLLRLADAETWTHLHPAPGQQAGSAAVDFVPVLAGSAIAHMYMHVYYSHPAPPPRPVLKRVREAAP